MTLKDDAGRERGYYLGRGADRLFLAQDTRLDGGGDEPVRHVVALNDDDIARVVYGGTAELPHAVQPNEGPWSGDGPEGSRQEGGGGSGGGGGGGGGGTGGNESGGGQEPAPSATPVDDPSPAPVALPEPEFRVAGTVNGVRAELQLLALVRRERVVELDAMIVNRSDSAGDPEPFTIGDALDDHAPGNEPFTADKLRLVEPAARKISPVLYDDEGGCACSQSLDRVELEPGRGWRIWAAFPAPPAPTAEVDLTAPGFGWIRRVPVR